MTLIDPTLVALADAVLSHLDDEDPDEPLSTHLIAEALDAALRVKSQVSDAIDALRIELADRLEDDETTFDGLPTLRRRDKVANRFRPGFTGQHIRERIVAETVEHVRADIAELTALMNPDGEIDKLRTGLAVEGATRALDYALGAIPSFSKVNDLGARRLGLSNDDFRVDETTGATVEFDGE